MSFIYPRTIKISRQVQSTTGGAAAYGGMVAASETVIASGIAASIQYQGNHRNEIDMPTNANGSRWLILFAGALGLVNKNDIITDDLGARYQVSANYWNSLGYNCHCELLEA